jgi:hypothetical protein
MIGWPNGLKKVYQVRLSFAGPECGQAVQQRRGTTDRGEYRQAARAFAEAVIRSGELISSPLPAAALKTS